MRDPRASVPIDTPSEAVTEPPLAERARTLLHVARVGTLATQLQNAPGFPFVSLAPFAIDGRGRPLFFFSGLAVHTRNLLADPRASLLVTPPGWGDDPLAGPRATLMGPVAAVMPEEVEATREVYLARHAAAAQWAAFKDFRFYRMELQDLYYVAGFGAMGWVEAEAYAHAAPDPLADSAAGILAHMNEDHADAVALYCRVLAGVAADTARMSAIDRLGFQLRATCDGHVRSLRLSFPGEVHTPEAARVALIALLRDARARAGETTDE